MNVEINPEEIVEKFISFTAPVIFGMYSRLIRKVYDLDSIEIIYVRIGDNYIVKAGENVLQVEVMTLEMHRQDLVEEFESLTSKIYVNYREGEGRNLDFIVTVSDEFIEDSLEIRVRKNEEEEYLREVKLCLVRHAYFYDDPGTFYIRDLDKAFSEILNIHAATRILNYLTTDQ